MGRGCNHATCLKQTSGRTRTVRVIATLSKLHDNVEKPRFSLLFARRPIDSVNILFQDHSVPFSLHVGHANVDVDLLLGEERVLNIGLDSSKQERPENLVKLLDDGVLIVVASHLEPRVEVLAKVEKEGCKDRHDNNCVSKSSAYIIRGDQTERKARTSTRRHLWTV